LSAHKFYKERDVAETFERQSKNIRLGQFKPLAALNS